MKKKNDKYGRSWNLPHQGLCRICGQPDNCGNCNHIKLSKKEVKVLGGVDNEKSI